MSDICEATSRDWPLYAADFPVNFAQVREDAFIDRLATALMPGCGLHGIMIASGGCTAAYLAGLGRFAALSVVDIKPQQLAIAKLKLGLLAGMHVRERLQILGHLPVSTCVRAQMLRLEMARHSIPDDTFGPFSEVSRVGVDFIGRYELLFKRLSHIIDCDAQTEILLGMNEVHKQSQFLDDNLDYVQRIKYAFDQVMTLDNLEMLFGYEATQNRLVPFSDHFYQQTICAIKTMPAGQNPYLAQMLLGQYGTLACPWLTLPKQPVVTHVDYIKSTMLQALTGADGLFDFIHLSNILDWLTIEQAYTLLEAASNKLRVGGVVIIRQLNSSINVRQFDSGLHWMQDLSSKLHKMDRSFFYRALHIARKQ